MTKRGFKAALIDLKLGTASKATMRALGLSRSQVQRLAHGQQKVSRQTELLLFMYQKHGIPKLLPGEHE